MTSKTNVAPARSPFKPHTQVAQGGYGGKAKAEAFINCTVKNANGDDVKISKGIALDSTTLVGRSIIAQASELFAAGEESMTIELTGTIKLVTDDSQDELMKF
jgi:hypothetical protein